MVFTWVSTGVVEPFVPKPIWGYRVPSTHPNQAPKNTDNDTGSFHIPEPGVPVGPPSPEISRRVQAYKESTATHRPGDVLKFVYEIMTERVDTLLESDPLEDAKRKFRLKRYRHIPILNSQNILSGIISDRDILRLLADNVPMESPIRNHMVDRVLTVSPDTEIRESAYVMIDQKIGCLPVVNPEQELVGILTRSDILRSITRKPPLELFA